MKDLIFYSKNDWTGFALRLTLAMIMFPHTIQHTTGGFGGFGYHGIMNYFTETLYIPWLLAVLVIIVEVLAPLMLIAGFASRIVAVSLIFLMIGIIITSHLPNGFFMNWLGNQQGEGYEYHLLYIGGAIALLLNGSGKFSLDNLI